MRSLSAPILYDQADHAHLLPQLAQIHADCVLQDHTLATFLPREDGAMAMDQLLSYWTSQAEQVNWPIERGQRRILMQLAPAVDGGDEEVAGVVMLWAPATQTGPFRGSVEKLLVSPRYRRKGVARALMGKLEEAARAEKREMLVLDTTIGTPAEHVYPRLGYKTVGVIPKYGISPKDGSLVDEIFYYKDLRDDEWCLPAREAT